MEEVPTRRFRSGPSAGSTRPKYKAEILAQYDALDRDGQGALPRREGPALLADQRVAKAGQQGRVGGAGQGEGSSTR